MNLFNTANASGVITDAPRFSQVAVNAMQFLLSVVGILAIIMLAASGTIYFFAAGDESRIRLAKKSTLYAVIGIIVALSANIILKFIGSFFST